MAENGKRSLNSESLKKVAEFMAGLDDLSSGTAVEIVGIVDIVVDGTSAGQLDCSTGSETVWNG